MSDNPVRDSLTRALEWILSASATFIGVGLFTIKAASYQPGGPNRAPWAVGMAGLTALLILFVWLSFFAVRKARKLMAERDKQP